MPGDPFDVGALLSAAADAWLAANPGKTHADIARAAGMPQQNYGRALRDPNARAPTARRILAALGHHAVAVKDQKAGKPR